MAKPKPSDKFPLWLHPSGQWCKKHQGVFHYFGTDKDEALKLYANEWDDRKAGRKPKPDAVESIRLADLCNTFLANRRELLTSGEITAATWGQYFQVCSRLTDHFSRNRSVTDLGPADFAELRAKVAESVGPVTLLGFITKARVVFKFAFDHGLIVHPVRYGNGFDRPSRKTLRLNRASKAPKMIKPQEAKKLIKAADPQLRAMILLALNGGMGATDCSQLTRSILDARPGWIDYPRPKTGTPRRFKLWKETQAALKAAAGIRPEAKDPEHADRVFLTRTGQPWVRFHGDENGKRSMMDAVAWQFTKLAKATGVVCTFYTLRHVHRTVSDEVGDRPAIDLIMGHTDQSMAANYRERIDDKRLEKVTKHVHDWLYGKKK